MLEIIGRNTRYTRRTTCSAGPKFAEHGIRKMLPNFADHGIRKMLPKFADHGIRKMLPKFADHGIRKMLMEKRVENRVPDKDRRYDRA